MTPERAAVLGGLVAFTFFSVMMNTTMPGWVNWYHMAKTGVMTQGIVSAVYPEQHRSCTLRYAVNGTSYETVASGCSDASIGASRQLRYLPADPSFATTRSPEAELTGEIFGAFLMSVFAALITGFRVSRRRGAAQQVTPADRSAAASQRQNGG